MPPTIDARLILRTTVLQHDLLTRQQCVAAGMTLEQIRHKIRSGRWTTLAPGVYLTVPGRESWDIEATCALLAACSVGPLDLEPGTGSTARTPLPPVALFGLSAARAWGIGPQSRVPITLATPADRQVNGPRGVLARRLRDWDERVDPFAFPWRTARAATIIDCAASSTADEALSWLARGLQKSFVPAKALAAELARRDRVRHGALMREALGDISAGAHSAAEVRFVRDVERAHGLPTARRQVSSSANGGAVHDNDYEQFGVVIEVDGRLGHEGWDNRIRDGRRDRQLGARGHWTSRVFWPDVAVTPCATAVDVANLLRARGWSGAPRRCRKDGCPAELRRFGP